VQRSVVVVPTESLNPWARLWQTSAIRSPLVSQNCWKLSGSLCVGCEVLGFHSQSLSGPTTASGKKSRGMAQEVRKLILLSCHTHCCLLSALFPTPLCPRLHPPGATTACHNHAPLVRPLFGGSKVFVYHGNAGKTIWARAFK
jgi:hypothetical protein